MTGGARGEDPQAAADLDDPARLEALDPTDFLGAVERLPEQVREGWRLGAAQRHLPPGEGIRGVAVLGMGGSGISGDVCRAVVGPRSPVVIEAVKGYELPGWAGPDALVLAVSYSGNTEETLAAFEQACERGARVVAVAGGGRLAELARRRGVPLVEVPGGLMPRAALGYLAMPILAVCERLGLWGSGAAVAEAAELLDQRVEECGRKSAIGVNPAKQLALRLLGRVPVVYGSEGLAGVAAYRWKCQFNENAKVPAFWNAVPELDHNEVMGWPPGSPLGPGFAAVVLRHAGEHARVATRIDATAEMVEPGVGFVEQAWARGASPLARLLDLACLGDFTSTYLGLARGIDPAPIRAIERLKEAIERPR